jgi:hypothetical protein
VHLVMSLKTGLLNLRIILFGEQPNKLDKKFLWIVLVTAMSSEK